MSGVTIRAASPADFEAIDRFDPFAGDRRAEIADGRLVVAEIAGEVIGYVSWQPSALVGRDYIAFVTVRDDQRRQGIARTLVRHAYERLSGRVFISTEEDNVAMLALLPAESWTFAGEIAGVNENGRSEVYFYKGDL